MQSNIIFPKDIRLKKYIEYFWYLSSGKKDISIPDPVLYPESRFDVVLSFASPTVWKTKSNQLVKIDGSFLLSGMRREPFVIDCTGKVEYLAIRFYADGLFPFINDSLNEINKAHSVELEDLGGKFWKYITEKTAESPGISERIEILEKELVKVLSLSNSSSSWVVNGALNKIQESSNPANLKEVVKDFGIYPKRLERDFKKYIGITPKLYNRIVRFNNVIEHVNKHTTKTHWAVTAQTFGYFDQSHMIKEFTSFLGMPPEKYLQLVDGYKNKLR